MLFFYELKKIWRPWMIGAAALIFLAVYYTDIRPQVQWSTSYYDNVYMVELVRRFGTTLEPEEEQQLEAELLELSRERDMWTAAYEPCKRYGITTFDEAAADEFGENGKLTVEEWNSLLSYLQSAKTGAIEKRWNVADTLVSYYQQFREGMKDPFSYEKEMIEGWKGWFAYKGWEAQSEEAYLQQVWDDLFTEKNYYSIMESRFLNTISLFFRYLLKPGIAALFILLLPTLVRDRSRRMRQLQWSSRKGRKICRTQFAAVMLSAAGIGLGCIVLAYLLTKKIHYTVFWDCQVTGNWCDFLNIANTRPYVNGTVGTWFWLSSALFLVLILFCGALIYLLSALIGHYFFMIIAGFFAWFLLYMIAGNVQYDAFTHLNAMTNFFHRPFAEVYFTGIALPLAIISVMIWLRSTKRKELKA